MTAPATVCAVAIDPDLARRLATAGRKSEEWRGKRDDLIREAASSGDPDQLTLLTIGARP